MRKSTFTREYAALRESLTALRHEAGLTQRGLAELLGVAHSWIAKVESGERRIDVVEFSWLVTACGSRPADAFELFVQSAKLDRAQSKGHKA
jgi:transcriptional regulator with XRE-family HTH domain